MKNENPGMRFRPSVGGLGDWRGDLGDVVRLIDRVWLPGHFFVDGALKLVWEFVPREETAWDEHQGQLLPSRECRAARFMAGWNIHQIIDGEKSDEPLIALKLDAAARRLHVLRAHRVYCLEIGSGETPAEREVVRWQRERVGTIVLDAFQDLEELRDEIVCRLWQAVVGTSRLPLTSVETPLPAFALGQLHYVFREELAGPDQETAVRPLRSWSDLATAGLAQAMDEGERAKLLDFCLRSLPEGEVEEATRHWLTEWRQNGKETTDLPRLLRRVFNDVSLSPYTSLVANALGFVRCLAAQGAMALLEEVDFLTHLLRQNFRHLSAYDLVLFHHRGANYPDALLLGEVLRRLLQVQLPADGRADLALVQGCLTLDRYRDHAVPQTPTSPGESMRVMPESIGRAALDEIEQPHRRRRRLFADWDWRHELGEAGIAALRRAVGLLAEEETFLELGAAVFIDRPFGDGKARFEADQTPLLAHEAFSLSLANGQLARWRRLLEEQGIALSAAERVLLEPRASAAVGGLSVRDVAAPGRPVPALADARRVCADFIVRRTLPGGVRLVHRLLGDALANVDDSPWREGVIIARVAEGETAVFDLLGRRRFTLKTDGSSFRSRAGIEWPANIRLLNV